MNREQFVREVRERTDLEDEAAVMAAADATLQALGKRVTDGRAEDLADHLTEPLARGVRAGDASDAAEFGDDEFVERVRENERVREDVTGGNAARHVQAVLAGLSDALNDEVWETTKEQLPEEYGHLYEPDERYERTTGSE